MPKKDIFMVLGKLENDKKSKLLENFISKEDNKIIYRWNQKFSPHINLNTW